MWRWKEGKEADLADEECQAEGSAWKERQISQRSKAWEKRREKVPFWGWKRENEGDFGLF